MPTRMLREGILESRAVSSLSDDGQIFYYRLISIVDDYGRYEADLEILRVKCFPLLLDRWPLSRVGAALSDARSAPSRDGHLITVYSSNGREYLQINNFNQRLRAKTSRCPSPDGQMPDTCPSSARLARVSPPLSPPSPSPNSESRSTVESAIADSAERMYSAHPKKSSWALVPDALLAAVNGAADLAAKLAEIEACHAAWTKTEDWTKSNGNFAKRLDLWISDRAYTKWPDGTGPPDPKKRTAADIDPAKIGTYDPTKFRKGNSKT